MSTDTPLYDRREIIASAVTAAAFATLPLGALAAPAAGAAEQKTLLADWSIDDQWGVYPRWEAIPCVPQHRDDPRLAVVHAADVSFIV